TGLSAPNAAVGRADQQAIAFDREHATAHIRGCLAGAGLLCLSRWLPSSLSQGGFDVRDPLAGRVGPRTVAPVGIHRGHPASRGGHLDLLGGRSPWFPA